MADRLTFHLPVDGETSEGIMHVLVPRGTGLVYQHQYGGYRCLHAEVEGFLVPVWADPQARSALDELFLIELRKDGMSFIRGSQRDDLVRRVDEACQGVWYRGEGDREAPLKVDLTRADELDEAWVPVLTPDGPGYLVWINSD